MKILVVDDEANILEAVEAKFRREGYSVFTAGSAEEGMRLFRLVRPDLLILDVMLPNRSGIELCRAVRKTSDAPVIFLSAKAAEDDRVAGLEAGGDDYVVKPFSLRELSARASRILKRRHGPDYDEAVESNGLKVDPRSHEATLDGAPIKLSPKEFALLRFFVANAGQVFTRDQLLDRVWGQDAYVSARTVDVHVRWLRERIEKEPSSPKRILTVRGVGYKFSG